MMKNPWNVAGVYHVVDGEPPAAPASAGLGVRLSSELKACKRFVNFGVTQLVQVPIPSDTSETMVGPSCGRHPTGCHE